MAFVVSKNRLDAFLSGVSKLQKEDCADNHCVVCDPYRGSLTWVYYFNPVIEMIPYRFGQVDVAEAKKLADALKWYAGLLESIEDKNIVLSCNYVEHDPVIKTREGWYNAVQWYKDAAARRDDEAILNSLVDNGFYVDDAEVWRNKKAV